VAGFQLTPDTVVEADGTVRVLRMFPCFLDGRFLFPCDSHEERLFAAYLRSKQLAFLKPVLRHDCDALAEKLGLGLRPNLITYRPDFFVFDQAPQSDLRAFIVELRGFKPGKIPAYDNLLEKKSAYFRSLPGSIQYVCRDAWATPADQSKTDTSNLNLSSFHRKWVGLSKAAHEWMEDQQT